MDTNQHKLPFYFLDKVVVRTPMLPFVRRPDYDLVHELFTKPLILEALYLASPSLYNKLRKYQDGEILPLKEKAKLYTSLYKYITRMSTRSTPFGLFAGCSVVHWDAENNLTLDSCFRRKTRLDMEYYCNLATDLCQVKEIRSKIKFYKNSSIYVVGDEYRFVNYQYINDKRVHTIISIKTNVYLRRIYDAASNGEYYEDLILAINDVDISENEKRGFLDELIRCQFLVSDLEPAITGNEPGAQLLQILDQTDNKRAATVAKILRKSRKLVSNIDKSGVNQLSDYQRIIDLHKEIDTTVSEGKFFQTDMARPIPEGQISKRIKPLLMEAFQALNYLTSKNQVPAFVKFKDRFAKRYGEQEVPLPESLDPDIGLGYGRKRGNHSPLVNDIPKSSRRVHDPSPKVILNSNQKLLHRLALWAYTEKKYEADLSDYLSFTPDHLKWRDLPDSLACLFQVISESKILAKYFTGSTAAKVLSRFSYVDDEIKDLCVEITDKEQDLAADKILAEIIHLPESRSGNILMHPAFRQYEIPYLGRSSLDTAQQIHVDDIMVSVQNDHVVLRSKTLDKIIVPRLTNAHNFSYNSQPIYQFLGDYQKQHTRECLLFEWQGITSLFKFLPRVTYKKDVILSPARWQFDQKDLKDINKVNSDDHQVLNAFRSKWRIPDLVTLTEADNELFIDFNSKLSVTTFLDYIKRKKLIVLREFLFDDSQSVVKDRDGNSYNNECIATLVRNPNLRKNATLPYKSKHNNNIKTSFPVGSEWLYFKLYCGQEASDTIIHRVVKPLVEQITKKALCKKWFFIRYEDPEFHLRVRFLLNSPDHTTELIKLMNNFASYHLKHHIIWSTQIDTYQRETARYGHNTIDLAESIFSYDSDAVLGLVSRLEQNNVREETKWMWSMKAIDTMLTTAGLNIAEKILVLEPLKETFSDEFMLDKAMKLKINDKYRCYKKSIQQLLSLDCPDNLLDEGLRIILAQRNVLISTEFQKLCTLELENKLEVHRYDILMAYIHMHMNRVYSSYQRLHELVVYDMLYKYYTTQLYISTPRKDEKLTSSFCKASVE